MSAGVLPATNQGVYCVDFHISMQGNKYQIDSSIPPFNTYNVTVKIKDGKAYCYIDNTELKPAQLVLITKCCLKAFHCYNLTTYVNNHGKCPECMRTLTPDKITIAKQEKTIKDLTKKVKEQAAELAFANGKAKYWEGQYSELEKTHSCK